MKEFLKMNKTTKKLIIVALIIIIIKVLISLTVTSPSAFSDEYVLTKMARSIFYDQNLNVGGIPSNVHPPLYPLAISLSYLLGKMTIVYGFMKGINAVLSTLIIIPLFLILREFLSEKKSLIASTVIAIAPPFFSFTGYIMAENLFYVLFLLFFFFIYRSLKTGEIKYDFIAGIFLGLAFLTKFSGITLFAIPVILILVKLIKRDFGKIKEKSKFTLNKIILLITAVVISSPWIIYKIKNFGLSITSLMGAYSQEATAAVKYENYALAFINWIILYSGYLIIASGVILGLIAIANIRKDFKENKDFYILSGITIFLFIIIASNHASAIVKIDSPFSWFTERPIGRYIETVLPIVMIIGFINIDKVKKENFKKILWIGIPLFLITSQLTIAKLFLVNNLSLSHMGSVTYLINFILNSQLNPSFNWNTFIIMAVIFMLVPIVIYLRRNKINFKNVSLITTSIFLILMIINSVTIVINTNDKWDKNEQMQMGKFLDKYDPKISTILYDQDYEGIMGYDNEDDVYDHFPNDNTFGAMSGFWLNDNLKVGDIEDVEGVDFIITRKELSFKKLRETSHGVKLYEVGGE